MMQLNRCWVFSNIWNTPPFFVIHLPECTRNPNPYRLSKSPACGKRLFLIRNITWFTLSVEVLSKVCKVGWVIPLNFHTSWIPTLLPFCRWWMIAVRRHSTDGNKPTRYGFTYSDPGCHWFMSTFKGRKYRAYLLVLPHNQKVLE